MILGIDVSTSCTGVTILDKDGNRLYCEAWDMRNKKYFPTIWNKIDFITNKLRELLLDYPIEHVWIEKPLGAFKKGQSSAQVISLLNKFNGMVALKCYETFGIQPDEISAISARNRNGIKVPRGVNAKKFVMNYLLANDPSWTVEWTPKGNPKPVFFDMMDSLIVARAGLKIINDGCLSNKKPYK